MENKSAAMKVSRGANFSAADRSLLIKLANNYKRVIEAKKTGAVCWREKESTWRKICLEFNSSSDGAPRNVRQLQEKYKAIKKNLRKLHSNHTQYMKGTGGGPYVPMPSPKDEEEKKLLDTIKLSVQGMENPLDCDGRAGLVGISPEIIPSEEMSGDDGANENISGELISVDWASPSCSLWQTPKDPRLSIRNSEDSSNIEVYNESLDDQLCDDNVPSRIDKYLLEGTRTILSSNKENETPKKGNQESTWTRRRRPVIKKKKTVSSAGARFELVAEKKLELIEYQRSIAENKLKQDKEEHELTMEILNVKKRKEMLKTEILSKGQMVFEF